MSPRARLGLVVAGLVAAGGFVAWWVTRESERPRLDRPGPTGSTAGAVADAGTRPASSPAAVISPKRFESSEETASTAALDPNRLYVTGKVVDDRRRAAPGASIELVTEGREPLRSKTGADGRFVIDCGPKPAGPRRGTVEASDANGRAAVLSLPEEMRDNVIDVGVLPLTELGVLAVRVVKDGAGVAGARVWAGPTHKLGFGPFPTDGNGTLGPKRLPEGAYVVTAFSEDLSARGEARVDVTRRGGAPVEIALAPAWRLGVTVKDGSTGKGVADQEIALTSSVRASERGMTTFRTLVPRRVVRTNADGRTVVEGLAADQPIEVEVLPAGELYLIQNNTRTKVAPGTGEVVLTLDDGGDAFTFPIVADETDGPPDGAEVRLSRRPGTSSAPPPRKGRVVGRTLVADHVTERNRSFLATAPDGSIANVAMTNEHVKEKIGPEVRFKKPRALVVSARDRAGAPLVGWLVQTSLAAGPPVPTGPDGSARIEGLYPWQAVAVTLRRPGAPEYAAKAVGSADLTPPGDGRLDVVLDSERPCVLHVTVDGEKRLPPMLQVGVVDARGLATGDVGPIEEDPDAATLRLGLRAEPDAASVKLGINARGFPYATVELPVPKGGAPLEGRVALISGGTLRVMVLPPADGLHEVGYETLQEDGSWSARHFQSQVAELGKRTAAHEASGLVAGRYRARDALTGLVTEPADLRPGSTAELTLDLSRAGVVTGRVEGPAEAEPAPSPRPGPGQGPTAQVSIEGRGLVPKAGGIQVGVNREFTARVPGDRLVTLRVTHPLLSPDPSLGAATVTTPGSTVILKLVTGPEASFNLTAMKTARERIEYYSGSRGRVLLFKGRPEGEPVANCQIVWEPKKIRFGGYQPGKYTLWCDPGEGAPFVIEDVRLGEGHTDLGERTLEEGATLRFRVTARDGQEAARFAVLVLPVSGPLYSRTGPTRKGETIVKALGAGRLKVEVRSTMTSSSAQPVAVYEVDSTGSGEIPLTHEAK